MPEITVDKYWNVYKYAKKHTDTQLSPLLTGARRNLHSYMSTLFVSNVYITICVGKVFTGIVCDKLVLIQLFHFLSFLPGEL